MSRTAMIAFVLTLIFFGKVALAGSCGDRVQGYNVDLDYDDKMHPYNLVSGPFAIEDYSRDSYFENILVRAPANATFEIGFLKTKKAQVSRKLSFKLAPSPEPKFKGQLIADGFKVSGTFEKGEKAFVFRIVNADGTTDCEDQPRPIDQGH